MASPTALKTEGFRSRAASTAQLACGALLVASLLAGCRITPEAIQRIETENELLRQQIQVVREKCAYYQELEIEAEEEPGAPAP